MRWPWAKKARRKSRADGKFNSFFVQRRQSAGQSETYRADMRVRLAAELSRAGAEYLCLSQQLYVDLEPDNSFVSHFKASHSTL